MNIGICFGGYCPLHRGHLDLIFKSKKVNDLTFVVVCGYDRETRGESIGLPLIKRYRIIKNFLEDELVKVVYINDTELGLDESMSPNNWRIWTDAIKNMIIKIIGGNKAFGSNKTWYVAEEFYKDCLEKYCSFPANVELIDRTLNPISGTRCREKPLKYWNVITAPFRAYFSHNIFMAGISGLRVQFTNNEMII